MENNTPNAIHCNKKYLLREEKIEQENISESFLKVFAVMVYFPLRSFVCILPYESPTNQHR